VPFPFSVVLAPCPEGNVTVQSTWRTDGTRDDLLGILSAECRGTPENDFNPNFRCFPSGVFVNCPALKAAAGALLAHLETMPHEGPAGPIGPAGPAGSIGPAGPIGFAGPTGQLPTLGTPDFNTLLQTLAAAIGALGGADQTTIFQPLPAAAPAVPLEVVRPGGTVNVPVVLGATGDPGGVRRPRFPDQDQLEQAARIGQLIANLLALRKAQQNADKQRRAFERFLAERLELLRRAQQMPFGQAGQFSAGNGGRDLIGDIIGAIGGIIGDQFGRPGFQPGVPQLPAPPPPFQGPGMFPTNGGGGGCPPLFRGGTMPVRVSPVPWFPVQAPNGKWFFFGHLGTPTFSKLKGRRRHHHHARKR